VDLPSSDVLSCRPRSSRAAVLYPRRRTRTIALAVALVLGITRRGRPRRSPQRLSWLGRQAPSPQRPSRPEHQAPGTQPPSGRAVPL